MTFLRRENSKIVPCLGIVWFQLNRLLEVAASFLESVPPQTERAQVVIRLGIVRFVCDDLLEGFRRLIEITSLKEGDSIGEIVALKCSQMQRALEGKGFPDTIARISEHRLRIVDQALGIHHSLVDLDDQTIFVN